MAQGALFDRYAPFVQDFIYRQNWAELRAVQTAAAQVLFESEDHLLLSGSTASGKTEAVFFPILTMLWEDPPQSIGCLYIAPLKSLINDQFYRMETLLDESGIPVTHWHGDVPSSQKEALLRCPRGILQITPESLEAMLLRRPNDIYRLFCDLRFVVIDEIHALMGSDRGDQILCQLCRIARLIGHTPRRIGLSATMGEPQLAARWLAGLDRGIPLVSSMGAGAKTDPTRMEIADIGRTHHCPLAHMLRKRLHKLGIRTGFRAVFSAEPAREGAMILCEEQNKKSNVGTISYLPALFGIGCASVVVRDLLGEMEDSGKRESND